MGKGHKLSLNSFWKNLSHREAEKQVGVCEAAFVLGQQIHFSKGACTTGKNMVRNHNISHCTPSLNYYIPKRLPQSPSYWAEQSFTVHGTSWNGAIVSCGVYSHSIQLRGNLRGWAQSRLSPLGLQRGEEVEPRANWTRSKCYWSKESEGVKYGKSVHDIAKEASIWGSGGVRECVCEYVCMLCFNRTQLAQGQGICLEWRRGDDLHWDTDPHDPVLAPWGTPCHQAKVTQRVWSQ